MAASTSNILQFVTTNAEFQAQIAAVRAALTAAGWMQVAQSNDINPATVAKPGAANTNAGTEIWRMADSLQSTYPIFLLVTYGTGAAATVMSYRFKLGQGNDGAGALTSPAGKQAPSSEIRASPQSTARSTDTTLYKSYFSGDTGRFCATLHAGVPSAPFPIAFFIERTRATNGAYTSQGVGLGACVTGTSDSGLSSSLYQYQYYPLDGSPLPPMEKKWGFLAPDMLLTSIKGNKAYTWPLTSLYPAMVNPFTSFEAYLKPDFGVGETLNVTVYGAPVPYMPIGGFAGFVDTRNTNLTFMQRYD